MMKRAIELGEKGRITAPPNPWVGCVLVKNHQIISEGYHHAAGEPHAEVNALNNLKGTAQEAQGATAYITLEPCSHFGKTPPCVNALIDAGIARVVIAQLDPDSRVAGQGVEILKKANIQVDLGIGSEEVKKSLAPYLWQRTTRRPFCIGKAAVSLDGRIAAADGSSKWISSSEARRDSHKLRAESQAILVGARTALLDHPSLTVRDWKEKPATPPLRVILDARGELSGNALNVAMPLLDTSLAPTLICTGSSCSERIKMEWKKLGLEVVEFPLLKDDRLNLKEILFLLGARGILQVMVEGGGRLLSTFYKENLLNKLVLYTGSCILGDKGVPLFRDLDISSMADIKRLKLESVSLLGDTIRHEYVSE